MSAEKFYFAYGGNTNPNHMNRSYPDAKFYDVGHVDGFQLVFRTHNFSNLEESYCDIFDVSTQHSADCKLPEAKVYGVVYSVSEKCIEKLDTQEIMYTKIEVPVALENIGTTVNCFTYQMIDQSLDLCKPSSRYFKVVSAGYKHYKIPMIQLRNAMFVSL